ncbi:MAG: hypothetical protein R3B47_00945 [Bacteroidia bacterium]
MEQLNLDPRNRMAAGLGAEVIRRNQERLMDEAWDQYEELFQVNSHLRRTQFVLEVKKALYTKHLDSANPVRRLQMRAPLSSTTLVNNDLMKRHIEVHLPAGLISSGYNKFTRPAGAMMKRFVAQAYGTSQVQETDSLGVNGVSLAVIRANTVHVQNGVFAPPGAGQVFFQLGKILDAYGKSNELKQGAQRLADYFRTNRGWYPPQPNQNLNLSLLLRSYVDYKLLPVNATYNRLKNRIANFPVDFNDRESDTFLSPILAAPTFTDPMYEELLNISFNDFVPNMDLVPPNTVGTLEPNREFIEAFMVGLNYEMARELLWREYPTDQRGTYFQHFWDSIDHDYHGDEQLDISPIHEWDRISSLGSHPGEGTSQGQLALVIRGDLFRRYPDMNIYLQKLDIDGKALEAAKLPVFKAYVKPDLFFLGFNETEATVSKEGQGWHFVLEERPGEINFGLDSTHHPPESITGLSSWDDLNWLHLGEKANDYINLDEHVPPTVANSSFYWGGKSSSSTSAHMAGILSQSPVRIFIKASELFLSA